MMFNKTHRFLLVSIVGVVITATAACQTHPVKNSEPDGVAAGVTGVDYLADHLSVQRFNVNGVVGGRAGKGGSTSCCATLPREWQPGMTVTVKWNVTNWRDCQGNEYEAEVPVEKYDEPGRLWINFLPHEQIQVVSSDIGPRNPDYLGPKRAIPKKYPWKKYPPRQHCPNSFK